MSLASAVRLFGLNCFPRVSGDEPGGLRDTIMAMMFSPRERG